MLYGGVEEAPNVSVEYQAADQFLHFMLHLSHSRVVELPQSTNAN